MSWWKLAQDEQPPPEIWGLDDDLGRWWEGVEARRKEKYGGTDDSDSSLERVPQSDNEFAKQLREQHGI